VQIASPVPSRSDGRAELDDLISRLVDRPGSASISHADGPSRKGSRPNSVLSTSQVSGENTEAFSPSSRPQSQSIAVQTAGTDPIVPAAELPPAPEPKPETVTYSKGVQTDGLKQRRPDSPDGSLESESEDGDGTRSGKRLSRRERERDEEIRKKLRKEIEDELQATNKLVEEELEERAAQSRYPLRTLNDDELQAVTSSGDFLDFVDRSAKVIERALDEEYDVLADYELGGVDGELEEDEEHGKKRRGIKEVCQFWDERWSKKRMISDLCFSPKVCDRRRLLGTCQRC
jgi:dynein intermediate chain